MLKTAVIGAGNMGKNHARVYSELEGSKLIAIAEISEEGKTIAEQYNCTHYSDYLEMLDSEDIDALSICVPTSLHKTVALECIDKGKHILIEKPIAATVEEAKEILKAARKKRTFVTVGHIERFNPAVQKLKEIMEERLGNPTCIIARRVGIFPPQIKDANVILDLAVHDIDVFNFLLGKTPIEVYAKSGKALGNKREDYAFITLDYGKTKCFVQVNWITPVKIRNLEVTGGKGYAELNYVTQNLKVFESVYEKTHDSFGDFILKFGIPNEIKIDINKEEPLKSEIQNFLDSTLKKSKPLITGEEGIKALQIVLKSIESYRKGQPIKLTFE
jgi:UDP-N-acetylglucosamine 3-dehydrogenase